MERKKCSKCKKELPIYKFSKCGHSGYQRYCKECKAKYVKNNREKINARSREYRKINSNNEKYASKRVMWRRTKFYKSLKNIWKCVICGTGEDVCIHHINNNPNDNTIINLLPLCRKHHSIEHKQNFKTT